MAGSASPRTIRVERSDRRVRVRAGGEWVADTTSALLMLEQGLVPVYYLPRSDVRMELLAPAAKRTRCETKGEAAYYTLRAGTFVAEDAAWSYESPIPGREQLSRYISFYWNRVEQWFEEDEEIFVHPRDPHKRVDAIRSSRHVSPRRRARCCSSRPGSPRATTSRRRTSDSICSSPPRAARSVPTRVSPPTTP